MINISEIADGRGVLFYASAETSLASIYREKSELPRRFPNLSNWYFAVIDLVDVTRLEADFSGIETLVGQDVRLATIFRPGFLVVVVAAGELPFGIGRMWQAVSDVTGWKSNVVRDRVSAEQWIQRNALADFGVEIPPLNLQQPSTGTNG